MHLRAVITYKLGLSETCKMLWLISGASVFRGHVDLEKERERRQTASNQVPLWALITRARAITAQASALLLSFIVC